MKNSTTNPAPKKKLEIEEIEIKELSTEELGKVSGGKVSQWERAGNGQTAGVDR